MFVVPLYLFIFVSIKRTEIPFDRNRDLAHSTIFKEKKKDCSQSNRDEAEGSNVSFDFLLMFQETLPASNKLMLHRKRFIKVPNSRLGSLHRSLVGKESWEDDVHYRRYSEDRDTY